MEMATLYLCLQAILLLSLNASPMAQALPAQGLHQSTISLSTEPDYTPVPVKGGDVDWLEFPINLEYLEAEFFLWSVFGYGLDKVAPELVSGGPPPIGGQKANLDPFLFEVIKEFADQEVGHLR